MSKIHSIDNGRTVQAKTLVLLVGGGFPDPLDIVNFKARAPMVVAADGGANFCLSTGVTPDFVIGDLDSISDDARAVLPDASLIKVENQNLTDFEKCLRSIDAPLVLATGFTSGRMDHLLAVFAVLARQIGPPTIIFGPDDIAFAVPKQFDIDLPVGTRVSLFPMVPTQGKSTGLTWPIDDLTIDPMGRLGTSNEVDGPVSLNFDTAGTLVLIPREHLAAAEAALLG